MAFGVFHSFIPFLFRSLLLFGYPLVYGPLGTMCQGRKVANMKRCRRFIHVLLLFAVTFAALLMAPGSAVSDPGLDFCSPKWAPEPEIYGRGVTAILTPPDSYGANPGSAGGGHYETHGIAGTQWHMIVSEDCFDTNRISPRNEIANFLWDANRIGSSLIIFVYQMAASDTLLTWLEKLVTSMVIGLRDGFWRPMIGVMVFIGAIWLAWVGLIKKRTTLTFEGVLWMIFSVALGFWLMASPSQALSAANTFTSIFTVSIHDSLGDTPLASSAACPPRGVAVGFQGSDNPTHFSESGGTEIEKEEQSEGGGERPNDPAENDGAGPAEPGDEADEDSDVIDDEESSGGDGEREPPDLTDLKLTPVSANEEIQPGDYSTPGAIDRNSDLMFCAFIYHPWAVGVFGEGPDSSEAADNFSRQTLAAQSVTPVEMDAYGRGPDFDEAAYDAMMEKKENEYRGVSEQVHHYYPESWSYWSGEASGDRILTSVVALIGLALGGSLVVAVSLALVILKAVFLFFLLAMPIVFAIGIHPGFGRRVLGWYGELLAGVAVMMVVLILTLTVFLILYGHIFALPLPWQGKVALMGLLLGVVLWGRKRIAKQVASMSTGVMGRIANRVANDKSLNYAAMTNPVVAIRKADRAVAGKVKEQLPLIIGAMTGGVGAAAAGAMGGGGKGKTPKPTGQRSPEQAPPLQDPPTASAQEVPNQSRPPSPGQTTGAGRLRSAPPPLRKQLPPSPPSPPPSGPQVPPSGPQTPSGAPGEPRPAQPPPRPSQTVQSPLRGRKVVIQKRGERPVSLPRDEVIEETHRPAPEQAPPLRRRRIIYDRPLAGGSRRRSDPPPRKGDPPPRT